MAESHRPPPPPPPPVTLHVLAFVTHDACLLPCWMRWMSTVLNAPTTTVQNQKVEYLLTVKTHTAPSGLLAKDKWRHVINARISFVNSYLESLPMNAVALFTDLDVVPFLPPATLLPLPYDITFMREPPGHGGRTGRHIVNAGLFAVRNCRSTRRLLGHWRWILGAYPKLMDQDVANWILLSKPESRMHHRNLSWGTWPRELASGLIEDVTESTAAFHAIFAVTDAEKLRRLEGAFERAHTRLPRCVLAAGNCSTMQRQEQQQQLVGGGVSDSKGRPRRSGGGPQRKKEPV